MGLKIKLNKRIGYALINSGRRAFVGTPVQRMKITNTIYTKIFKSMFEEGDVQTVYKGVHLTLPTKDATIVPSILGGYFESLELDLFAAAARNSKSVIDVGGNIGLFSLLAGKNIKPGGYVYAFEPVTENITYFNKNVLKNECDNIVLITKAVGAKIGNLDIYLSDENIGIHSASKIHSGGKEKITVPMTTIDVFVNEGSIASVDVLKIDVEGYDGYVLKGASKTIKKFKPTIFIEYDPRGLKSCGFEPDKFSEFLFGQYQYCLRVNEMDKTVTSISQTELMELPVFCNENLVFTNDATLLENIKDF